MIVENASRGIHLPLNFNRNFEAVSMNLTTFVPLRKMGEGLGGFKIKIFNKDDFHNGFFI